MLRALDCSLSQLLLVSYFLIPTDRRILSFADGLLHIRWDEMAKKITNGRIRGVKER